MLLRREARFLGRGGEFLRRGGGSQEEAFSQRNKRRATSSEVGGWLLKKGGILKKPVEVLKEFDPLMSTLSVSLNMTAVSASSLLLPL